MRLYLSVSAFALAACATLLLHAGFYPLGCYVLALALGASLGAYAVGKR